MKTFNPQVNREFLMKRMGDMSQLAGTKRYLLLDGRSKGVEAVDFKTGSGFCFTVLPGRGMDIAWADYKGVPVGYISKSGIASARHYESEGLSWLRNFFGGLLTTCGLSNVGSPCTDDVPVIGRQSYGLHGRISNIEADNVCVKSEWQGEEYVLSAEGRLRESMLHGENLTLTRSVFTRLGSKGLHIRDRVRNEGFSIQPLMLLYHMNIGYPILDSGSRFVCSSEGILAADNLSMTRIGQYEEVDEPVNGALENLYFHQPLFDGAGYARAGVINQELEFGVYVKFRPSQLKNLIQWKQLGESEYVMGIEPANCLPIGRQEMRDRNALEYLQPGEEREFELEIGILDGQDELDEFLLQVKG